MCDNCPSLYINEINMFLLMYADDTMLLAESPENLQTLLNSVQDYTQRWVLTVNTSKTKIVVFRSSWRVYDKESWTFNDDTIEVVDSFRYLGLVLKYNGKFHTTQTMLAAQAQKAMYCLMKTVKETHFNIQTELELFGTYVGSILNYGCEIWGNHKVPDIERVHHNFLKRILGVKRSTLNMMVYRELDRYPLHINRCVRQVRYWVKVRNSNNCIMQSVYNLLLSECDLMPKNKYNCLREIKSILSSVGMNNVWVYPESMSVQLLIFKLQMLWYVFEILKIFLA